ncbi:MAG TPA: hypothetical protein VGQ20_05980 [Acidimicrobiales bacterium]|jgi:hypothetical protein|nr:hypothetical protein [Acidimicrobiales bacterium]
MVGQAALGDRLTGAVTRASELCDRSELAVITAADIRHAVRRARAARRHGLRLRPGDFRVEGVLDDGTEASASFVRGHLVADAELLDRARIIIAMGDRFADPDIPDAGFDASLDGPPIAVALTFIRAFARVTGLELALAK